MTRASKAIILTGMMGSGKTTVGEKLAEALGRPFYDCDREIRATGGKTIAEFFREDGEQAFRALEKQTALNLLVRENAVIALGGGAFMDDEIRERIRAEATSVWLSGSAEVFYGRVREADDRPLVQKTGGLEQFVDLYLARLPLYREADIAIANDGASVQNTVEEILRALEGQ